MTLRNSKNISKFYDDFSKKRLLRDLDSLNIRQVAAINLCKAFIRRRSAVLELGCGIGIVSRALRPRTRKYLATDISAATIDLARVVLAGTETRLMAFDAIRDDPKVVGAYGPFDAIVMIDVIEHIPLSEHAKLFELIENLLVPGGRLILTYPSPEYQNYLYKHKPEEIQIVDEIVYLKDILERTNLTPIYFSTKDIWKVRQYVHLVLENIADPYLVDVHRSKWEIGRQKLRNRLWQISNIKLRKMLGNLQQSG